MKGYMHPCSTYTCTPFIYSLPLPSHGLKEITWSRSGHAGRPKEPSRPLGIGKDLVSPKTLVSVQDNAGALHTHTHTHTHTHNSD